MRDFLESFALWVISIVMICIFASVGFTIYDRISNYDNLVHIEDNSIGCSKYRLRGDEWWECPKGYNISQITEYKRSGKAYVRHEVPVLENYE